MLSENIYTTKRLVSAESQFNMAQLNFSICSFTISIYSTVKFNFVYCLACHYFGPAKPLTFIKHLLSVNCDVNLPDRHGWTPFYQSVSAGETGDIVIYYEYDTRLVWHSHIYDL